MKQSLKRTLPTAEAISKLLYPFAEVVVHDMETDSVAAIYNTFSQREVGDDSYLQGRYDTVTEDTMVVGPYSKTNWDGRFLKSVTVVLRNDDRRVEGFMCINMDVSHFKGHQDLLGAFLGIDGKTQSDKELHFGDDMYEKVNVFVQNYCRENHVTLETLKRSQKQDLVNRLDAEGAFEGKNAATYIARVLDISRATVYNYLKCKVA